MQTLLIGGIPFDDVYEIIKIFDEHLDLRTIPAGEPVEMVFPPPGQPPAVGTGIVEAVIMELGEGRYLRAVRSRADGWSAEARTRILRERKSFASNRIDTSLFAAAEEAELPPSVTQQFIRTYSHIVDFQRDIRKGDEFKVFYTQKYDTHGNVQDDSAHLHYLSLSVQGKQKQLWRHTDPETGIVDYFDREGRSVKRLLMRTPIDGARLSSGYGMRSHPILGYSRMHQGLDFAAPKGTPVFASGNGVVVRIGRDHGYGNFIRLRHANGYETLYAHFHKYAKGLKKGSRVEQGQTIGYVGSTGLSTGPHLHYEVHLLGDSMDPHSFEIPIGRVLDGEEMAAFQEERIRLEQLAHQAAGNTVSPSSSTSVADR